MNRLPVMTGLQFITMESDSIRFLTSGPGYPQHLVYIQKFLPGFSQGFASLLLFSINLLPLWKKHRSHSCWHTNDELFYDDCFECAVNLKSWNEKKKKNFPWQILAAFISHLSSVPNPWWLWLGLGLGSTPPETYKWCNRRCMCVKRQEKRENQRQKCKPCDLIREAESWGINNAFPRVKFFHKAIISTQSSHQKLNMRQQKWDKHQLMS